MKCVQKNKNLKSVRHCQSVASYELTTWVRKERRLLVHLLWSFCCSSCRPGRQVASLLLCCWSWKLFWIPHRQNVDSPYCKLDIIVHLIYLHFHVNARWRHKSRAETVTTRPVFWSLKRFIDIMKCALSVRIPRFCSSDTDFQNNVTNHRNGACAHYVMVSKFQWKPFWLATQRDRQNDWTATQNRVNYDVFAQAPLEITQINLTEMTVRIMAWYS